MPPTNQPKNPAEDPESYGIFSRAGQPRWSLCGYARRGYFGRVREIPPVQGRAKAFNLCKLSRETDDFASMPQLLAVNVSAQSPEVAGDAGDDFEVFARVEWETGNGRHFAEVDVPADGTTFTVVAADGLNVDLVRTPSDDNEETLQGTITVGFAATAPGCCSATRTVATVTPDEARIPAFARDVQLMSTDAGVTAYTITFRATPGGPALAAFLVGAADVVRVPNGARFFSVFVPSPGATVRAVFGLQL